MSTTRQKLRKLGHSVAKVKVIMEAFEDLDYEPEECDLSMITFCVVCKAVLMPEDECYGEYGTGKPLCDDHSRNWIGKNGEEGYKRWTVKRDGPIVKYTG